MKLTNTANKGAVYRASEFAAVQMATTTACRPVFIRLPKPGTLCAWTGLNRTKMWQLVQASKIRNTSLAEPGKRGVRLIHLESLLAHLNSLTKEGI